MSNAFSKWWVSEVGRPPLSEESEVYDRCRRAFLAGTSDEHSLTFDEKRDELSEINEQCILFDGYEGALVGYSIRYGREPIAIYDYERCLEILMTKGEGGFDEALSYEEALEWFEFNTLGCWAGDCTPSFLIRFGER